MFVIHFFTHHENSYLYVLTVPFSVVLLVLKTRLTSSREKKEFTYLTFTILLICTSFYGIIVLKRIDNDALNLRKRGSLKKIKKIEFHKVNNNNRVTFGGERGEKKNKRSDVIKFNLIYIISSYFRPNQHDFTSVFRWPIFLV